MSIHFHPFSSILSVFVSDPHIMVLNVLSDNNTTFFLVANFLFCCTEKGEMNSGEHYCPYLEGTTNIYIRGHRERLALIMLQWFGAVGVQHLCVVQHLRKVDDLPTQLQISLHYTNQFVLHNMLKLHGLDSLR